MSEPQDHLTNIQKAVAFFEQPTWSRLLEALYDKYMTRGHVGGQIILHNCTTEEQREIARFLQKRRPLHSDFTIRLADFQQALEASGFACDLPTLLMALFPQRSHITRPEQRERRAVSQQQF